VYVVVAENHVDAVLSMVPKDVGVMLLNNRHQISTLQDAADRPERTSPHSIFESIRTEEARAILRAKGVAIPDVPNTMMRAILKRIIRAA
jgi:hypothetical protein